MDCSCVLKLDNFLGYFKMDLKFKVKNCKWTNREHTQFLCEAFYDNFNSWVSLRCEEKSLFFLGDEIWKIREDLEIEEFEDSRTLDEVKLSKLSEIKSEKLKILSKGSISFKNDTFSIDDTSLLRISSTIQDWKDQIDNGLNESDIIQKWVSQTNEVHDLTYAELVDLARNMRLKVQSVVLYANSLKDQVAQCNTIEEIDNIKWTFD